MRILVANANTTEAVTGRVAAEARRHAGAGTVIVPATAAFGVAIVSTEAENVVAGHAALDMLARHAGEIDAAILAISFDTAVFAAQELFALPVVGMTAAAMHTACLAGRRFGLITFGGQSRRMYLDLVEAYGLSGRLAGCETIELASAEAYLAVGALDAAVLEAAGRLRRAGAASAVVAGAATAGMAGRLQDGAPLHLLDGMACAVRQAETLVGLGVRVARPVALVRGVAPVGVGAALGVALGGGGASS